MNTNLSVLVVDDYPPLANSVAQILHLKGLEVQTANSGSEALHILEAHPVDVLLTDVMMPDMTGLELYRATKKIYTPVIAILMSAFAPEDLLRQGMAEGVRAVLDKPLDINFLMALFSTLKGSDSLAI
jgi:CheY-like chemotaxis protein